MTVCNYCENEKGTDTFEPFECGVCHNDPVQAKQNRLDNLYKQFTKDQVLVISEIVELELELENHCNQ